MNPLRAILLLLSAAAALFLALPLPSSAQLPAALDVVVHTTTVPPFVGVSGGAYVGFDVDFVTEVFRRLENDADAPVAVAPSSPLAFEEQGSIADVLGAVQAAEAGNTSRLEVGIASITITSAREETVDFSPSYFQSGLQVMARSTNDFDKVAARVVRNFFVALALFVAGIFVIISVVSPIAFAVESVWPGEGEVPLFWRDEAKGATKAYKMMWGVVRALMWTTFTLFGTQTGYPTGMAGRCVHGSLKTLRILLFVVATSIFTNVFAVSTDTTDINGIGDLGGSVVTCTVADTTSQQFLEQNNVVNLFLRPTVDDMFDSFWAGDCDAALYDFPVLQGNLASRSADPELDADASLVGDVFQRETYGVALPQGSEWEEPFRRALLAVVGDTGFMEGLESDYLGDGSASGANDSLEVPTAWIVVPCVLGFITTAVVVVLLYHSYETKEGAYRTTQLNKFDRSYEDDYVALRQRELINYDYLYGTDYVTEVNLLLAMRATRVLYERELRDKGIDLDACERQAISRNATLQQTFQNLDGVRAQAHAAQGVRQRGAGPGEVRVELPRMPDSPGRQPAPAPQQAHDV